MIAIGHEAGKDDEGHSTGNSMVLVAREQQEESTRGLLGSVTQEDLGYNGLNQCHGLRVVHLLTD
jgi:hypothetical protein